MFFFLFFFKKPPKHQLTCMPLGLMTSKAAVMLVTNWRTLLKLSSPILQEPSIRKTRSALAPLHTAMQVKQR